MPINTIWVDALTGGLGTIIILEIY